MFPVKSANYPTKNTTREGFGSPGQRKTGNEKQRREPSPTTTDLLTGSQYEYDANGNITVIKEAYTSGSTIAYRPVAEYVYDELNQLKTETRKTYTGTSTTPTTTTVVTYVIDTAGNISGATTEVNGVVTDTVEYTYGNAYWSDRLTAINVNGTSKNISYATYLNPSSWYNGTHEFTKTQGTVLCVACEVLISPCFR